MNEFIQDYLNKFSRFPRGFLDANDLMHWQWFLLNLLAVLLLTVFFSKNRKRSWRRLKAHLRSRRLRTEGWLDLQFFVLKIFYQPLKILLLMPVFLLLAEASKNQGRWLSSLLHIPPTELAELAGHLFKVLWVLCAYDFAYYWSHRIQHRVEFFWHLHSVHHRSTYLAPLLKYRTHPLDTIINNIFSFTVGAFAMGVFDSLFIVHGAKSEYNLAYIGIAFFTHFIFGHIRHSVYWISYGPFLSKIFMSPAMHQIHHSIAPEHQGKNLATMFSIWDLMFGTLYIPQKKEVLRFGDTPEIRKEEKTLWKEIANPLSAAIKSLFKTPQWRWAASCGGILIFLLVMSLASCARAQTSPCQKFLSEITLPATFLNAAADYTDKTFFLPTPENLCLKVGGSLQLKDSYGRTMGRFFPAKTWSGLFTEFMPKNAKNELAHAYSADLFSQNITPDIGLPIIMNLLYDVAIDTLKSPVHIWSGKITPEPGYYFDDQNLHGQKSIAGLVRISYENLVTELSAKAPLYSYIASEDADSWRIPTTRQAFAKGTEDYRLHLISLSDLVREASQGKLKFPTGCGPQRVVFYGSVGMNPEFFNVHDLIKSMGCKNRAWYAGGYLEWQFPAEQRFLERERIGDDVLLQAESLKTISDDTLLVDLRSREKYEKGHIPGALNIPIQLDIESKFNIQGKISAYSFTPHASALLLDRAMDKKKVIYYTDGLDLLNLRSLKGTMKAFEAPDDKGALRFNTTLYLGGYRDWQNRARWMPTQYAIDSIETEVTPEETP